MVFVDSFSLVHENYIHKVRVILYFYLLEYLDWLKAGEFPVDESLILEENICGYLM